MFEGAEVGVDVMGWVHEGVSGCEVVVLWPGRKERHLHLLHQKTASLISPFSFCENEGIIMRMKALDGYPNLVLRSKHWRDILRHNITLLYRLNTFLLFF